MIKDSEGNITTDVFIKADNPSNNLLNQQTVDTPFTESKQLELLKISVYSLNRIKQVYLELIQLTLIILLMKVKWSLIRFTFFLIQKFMVM